MMNGGQVPSSVAVVNVLTTWAIVGTGDFNGDGKTDILWRRQRQRSDLDDEWRCGRVKRLCGKCADQLVGLIELTFTPVPSSRELDLHYGLWIVLNDMDMQQLLMWGWGKAWNGGGGG